MRTSWGPPKGPNQRVHGFSPPVPITRSLPQSSLSTTIPKIWRTSDAFPMPQGDGSGLGARPVPSEALRSVERSRRDRLSGSNFRDRRNPLEHGCVEQS